MRPLALLLLLPLMAAAQPPDFPAPKTFPPDAATLKQITDKTAELKKATEAITDPDVRVYLKAAEWVVKHGEWYTDKSAAQTVAVLDAGLERAKTAAKKPWLEVRGKPVVRGYRSFVDDSIQPYSVRFPDDYDAMKKYRADIILHGRDATLTEVKFLHAKETAKAGKKLDHFEVEVYGRGNNAYRWAGEKDVFDVLKAVRELGSVDAGQVVLRGFSMGGAGTWHLGLHHPFAFAVIGPGAGFSTTREYIGEKKFGPQPDYIEKCLRIYDAVDYAENAFHVPVVAYSGEKDKQKLAADLIEAKLKGFKEPHSFTHLVAPGLEHKQPPEWMDKLEAEYQKHLKTPRAVPERVRVVTYTPRYTGTHDSSAEHGWARPLALEKQYERAVVDGRVKDGAIAVTTENVRLLVVDVGLLRKHLKLPTDAPLTVDGQAVPAAAKAAFLVGLERAGGKWVEADLLGLLTSDAKPIKWQSRCGPIDDAFTSWFTVVPPAGTPWHAGTAAFADARRQEFARNWDKHFRGELRTTTADEQLKRKEWRSTAVLFGDPQSNPAIAEVLPKLPITWTKEKLVVNGKEYDPKTHLPVLVYPNPKGNGYVVINSGHTFREADLKGTNALLYPRLGDWAVLKPKPTKDDPAAFEVVDAGLFDENWQFKK
jgi:dienelactone hydrolase